MEKLEIFKQVGRNIQQIRLSKGLSQVDLVGRIEGNIDTTNISRSYRARTYQPNLADPLSYCSGFGSAFNRFSSKQHGKGNGKINTKKRVANLQLFIIDFLYTKEYTLSPYLSHWRQYNNEQLWIHKTVHTMHS